MKILNIYALSGLFYELYNPQVGDFNTSRLCTANINPLRRTNALFWAQLFSSQSLNTLVKTMKDACKFKKMLSIQEKAILSAPDVFVRLASQAPLRILDQGLNQQDFFMWLEILTIACRMFSEYIYYPHEITVQDGFLLPDFSTEKMFDISMDKVKNPYLPFLEENVFPLIDEDEYDFVWINGQPKTSSIAIAAYVKEKCPRCIVAVRNHSSEYYSLNKIEVMLKNNRLLFTIIDCIVLDDNQTTYKNIERMISDGLIDFSCISNVVYMDKETNDICLSKAQKVNIKFDECISIRDQNDDIKYAISPSKIVNLRLNPNTQCFWKKCTFCGINEKYKYISDCENESMEIKCTEIESLIKRGVEYFWFEDEAISPESLSQFADSVISKGLNLKWQARSRFHFGFTQELCNKLYKAGLREIRFGLESACYRILTSMNKFDANINLDIVDEIVGRFIAAGIHVHFPMIVGYPTESADERRQTYEFLCRIKEKYRYFSFNVNVLMLDVSSRLYKNFSNYDISTVSYPCSPSGFLGNMVSFDCSESRYSYTEIDDERIAFMASSLYKWMPITALTKSHIYYRLSETIRDTLIWSDKERSIKRIVSNERYVKNANISAWRDGENYLIYNWITHGIIGCSNEDYQFLNSIEEISYDELVLSEKMKDIADLKLILVANEGE